jgi:hypothetical protein
VGEECTECAVRTTGIIALGGKTELKCTRKIMIKLLNYQNMGTSYSFPLFAPFWIDRGGDFNVEAAEYRKWRLDTTYNTRELKRIINVHKTESN